MSYKKLIERVHPHIHHKIAMMDSESRNIVLGILNENDSYGDLTILEASYLASRFALSYDMIKLQFDLLDENITSVSI
jgi:hypothetical protein